HQTIFPYRRKHLPVGLFSFFLELFGPLYRLFAETVCTCFDAHFGAASVVSDGTEDVEEAGGTRSCEVHALRFNLYVALAGIPPWRTIFAVFPWLPVAS